MPELSPDDENFGPMCIDLASVRAWTIAEENYELDSLRFYPEQDGSFTAFHPVGSVAGANWYYRERMGGRQSAALRLLLRQCCSDR